MRLIGFYFSTKFEVSQLDKLEDMDQHNNEYLCKIHFDLEIRLLIMGHVHSQIPHQTSFMLYYHHIKFEVY